MHHAAVAQPVQHTRLVRKGGGGAARLARGRNARQRYDLCAWTHRVGDVVLARSNGHWQSLQAKLCTLNQVHSAGGEQQAAGAAHTP